ncbi:MAG: hypothetical protein PHT30_02300 [Bacilli bacterium]|nr:hypothetical protein [Bacilli bacterium]
MKQSTQFTISDATKKDNLDVPQNYGLKSAEKFRQGANFGHRVFTEKCRGNKYYAWKYLDKVCAEKRLSPFKAGVVAELNKRLDRKHPVATAKGF